MLHKLLGTILRLPTLSGNNDVAGGMVRQDCLEDKGWLNMALTIFSING